MKKIILLLVSLVLIISLKAQSNPEIFTLSGTYGFPTNYESPFENHKAKPAGLIVDVKAPIPFSESTAWFSQITYTTFHINNDADISPEIANPIHLHSIYTANGTF